MALQWTMEQMKQDDEETMDRLAPLLAAKGFDRNGLPLHHHQVASVAAEVGLGRMGTLCRRSRSQRSQYTTTMERREEDRGEDKRMAVIVGRRSRSSWECRVGSEVFRACALALGRLASPRFLSS